MENESIPVHHQLDAAQVMLIKGNRAKIASILKTIIFCGKQNISLRGHRDDSKHYDNTSNTKLLDFRVDSGDKVLENHLNDCKKNATYRSKTIQNELINCCSDYITEHLVDDIKLSGFFSIIADEATDSNNTEQLVLTIRYYSEISKEVREVFLRFIPCKDGTTGQLLASEIIKIISDMSLCR